MKKSAMIPTLVTLLLLTALVIGSDGAVSGGVSALHTCGNLIIPCLFPFFTISYMAGSIGLPGYLGHKLNKPMSILFGTSGTGASIFILSILGGYPLGAAVIADHVQRGELTTEEGCKLLTFCNNSGPAFLIGAVGIGVFHSPLAGLLLYAVHILSALITGLFLSGEKLPTLHTTPVYISSANLSVALPDAISKAAIQMLQICGYVVFFGAAIGVIEEFGLFSDIYGTLSAYTGFPLSHCRGLIMGLMELGCGIGAMADVPISPHSLALCSFLTGFGGISVCMQTAGVLSGTSVKLRHHIIGRLCCGSIGAFIMFSITSPLL